MTNEYEIHKQIELAKHARRLGGYEQTCIVCGEPNQRCLELHHLEGQAYGETLVSVCGNCHKKLTDPKANKRAPEYVSRLDQVGHFLLGLAELLLLLAMKALEFGQQLIEAAKVCPRPYGTLEVA